MKYYLRGFGVGVVFVTILFIIIREPGSMTDAQVQSRAASLGMLTAQEAEEKRLSAIRESELKWKDELEKQKEDYEALLRQGEDGVSKDNSEDDNTTDSTSGDGESDQKGEDKTTGNPEGEGDKQDEKEGDTAGTPEDGDNKQNQEDDGTDGNHSEKDAQNNGGDGQEGTEGDTSGGGESDENGQDDETTTGNQSKPGLVKIEIRSGMHAGQVADLLEENGIIESAEEFQKYLKEQNRQTLIQIGRFEFRQGEDFDVIIDAITRR